MPLRELCRKFDGYQEMRIDAKVVPPLVLPPEANKFPSDAAALLQMAKEHGYTLWSISNSYTMPVRRHAPPRAATCTSGPHGARMRRHPPPRVEWSVERSCADHVGVGGSPCDGAAGGVAPEDALSL